MLLLLLLFVHCWCSGAISSAGCLRSNNTVTAPAGCSIMFVGSRMLKMWTRGGTIFSAVDAASGFSGPRGANGTTSAVATAFLSTNYRIESISTNQKNNLFYIIWGSNSLHSTISLVFYVYLWVSMMEKWRDAMVLVSTRMPSSRHATHWRHLHEPLASSSSRPHQSSKRSEFDNNWRQQLNASGFQTHNHTRSRL